MCHEGQNGGNKKHKEPKAVWARQTPSHPGLRILPSMAIGEGRVLWAARSKVL